MKLSAALVMFVFLAVSFVLMMHVKNDVQALQHRRAALVAEQAQLREAERVVEAEYAYLSRPDRLRTYAEGAGLQPVTSGQIKILSVAATGGRL